MKDIKALSDDELRAQILAFGVDAGPILKSTRRVYQIKLEKLLNEVHTELKPKTVVPQKPVILDPEPKAKVVQQVIPDEVTEEPEVYDDSADEPETDENYEDEFDASPDIEIPRPIPEVTFTSKSDMSHNLPDYKRPPLKSSWKEMDMSTTEYESTRSTITHRRDGRAEGENVDAKPNAQTKNKDAKSAVTKRSKFSTCLQIIVFLIFCVILFLIFTNMEPEHKNPFQEAISSQ